MGNLLSMNGDNERAFNEQRKAKKAAKKAKKAAKKHATEDLNTNNKSAPVAAAGKWPRSHTMEEHAYPLPDIREERIKELEEEIVNLRAQQQQRQNGSSANHHVDDANQHKMQFRALQQPGRPQSMGPLPSSSSSSSIPRDRSPQAAARPPSSVGFSNSARPIPSSQVIGAPIKENNTVGFAPQQQQQQPQWGPIGSGGASSASRAPSRPGTAGGPLRSSNIINTTSTPHHHHQQGPLPGSSSRGMVNTNNGIPMSRARTPDGMGMKNPNHPRANPSASVRGGYNAGSSSPPLSSRSAVHQSVRGGGMQQQQQQFQQQHHHRQGQPVSSTYSYGNNDENYPQYNNYHQQQRSPHEMWSSPVDEEGILI